MKAEQILIELLEKLNHDIIAANAYIESAIPDGYVDEYERALIDVNKVLISWVEERIEVKKTLIIKEK